MLVQMLGPPDYDDVERLPQEMSEKDELQLSPGFFNLLELDPEASQESDDEDGEPAAKHP